MAHTLLGRWTIPAWVTLLLIVVDNIRRVFGWWSEIDFFWDGLKRRNEMLDAIISPYGQLVAIAISVVWLFVVSRPHVEVSPPQAPPLPSPASSARQEALPPAEKHPVEASATLMVGERIVLNVTPEYLTGFFDQHMTIQANKLVEAYIGKWIKVAGPLGDVYPNQVTFAHKTYEVIVFMYFDMNKWKDRLSVLTRDSRIEVIGQVERVNRIEVHLTNCELINS